MRPRTLLAGAAVVGALAAWGAYGIAAARSSGAAVTTRVAATQRYDHLGADMPRLDSGAMRDIRMREMHHQMLGRDPQMRQMHRQMMQGASMGDPTTSDPMMKGM